MSAERAYIRDQSLVESVQEKIIHPVFEGGEKPVLRFSPNQALYGALDQGNNEGYLLLGQGETDPYYALVIRGERVDSLHKFFLQEDVKDLIETAEDASVRFYDATPISVHIEKRDYGDEGHYFAARLKLNEENPSDKNEIIKEILTEHGFVC